MVGAISGGGSSSASINSPVAIASAMMLRKAMEIPGQAIIRMLNAMVEGVGGNIDFYA